MNSANSRVPSMKLAAIALALLAVALGCGLAAARSAPNSLSWQQFKRQHGKRYDTAAEEARRFANFLANKQLVEAHNRKPFKSFDMALNHLADWTDEELARLNGLKVDESQLRSSIELSDKELAEILGPAREAPLPAEFDWRERAGRVGAVKNQRQCQSCWAFATTGLLEGQELGRNMSSLVSLSEQELVDCAKTSHGCQGGWMAAALDDLVEIGGIEAEADYGYTSRDGQCNKNMAKFQPIKVSGHRMLPPGDERALQRVLVNYGPVAVAVDATSAFQMYQQGVLDDESCVAKRPDHGLLLVGYGSDAALGDFWILKNSWSEVWGERGYIRMRRGKNMCGIADFGTIAAFDSS